MKFHVYGPFKLPLTGRIEQSSNEVQTKFFKQTSTSAHTKVGKTLSDACGCYVFAISAQGGTLPWYVGKTGNTFRNECLTDRNINKFSKLLNARGVNQGRGGKPELYLLPQMTSTGKKFSAGDTSSINFLEDMLIRMGIQCNKNLANIRKTKKLRELEVDGFFNSKQRGRPKKAEQQLRDVFGLK